MKIAICVDLNQKNKNYFKTILKTTQILTEVWSFEVNMISFLGPNQKIALEVLESVGLKVNQFKIVKSQHSSSRLQAEKAALWFSKQSYNAILCLSHSNSRLKRFFLGSFTDTLAHESLVSVWVVNPSQVDYLKQKSLVFAMDMSNKSFKFFKKFRGFLSQIEGNGVVTFVEEPWMSNSDLDKKSSQEKLAIQMKIEQLKSSLSKESRVKFVYQKNKWSHIPSELVEVGKKHQAGLICVYDQKSKWGKRLLGSISTQLIHQGEFPVIIMKS